MTERQTALANLLSEAIDKLEDAKKMVGKNPIFSNPEYSVTFTTPDGRSYELTLKEADR